MTIKALQAAEVDVCPINFNTKTPHSTSDSTIQNIEENLRFPINIIQINPDMIECFIKNGGNELLKNRYNIAYWAWELAEYPDNYLPYFSLFNEIWTPSNFCSRAISTRSLIPVLTFNHPVLQNHSTVEREDLNLPKDKFIVLSMFDFCSSSERKNIESTVEAFKRSLGNDPSAILVVKSSKGDLFPEEQAKLEQQLRTLKNAIHIKSIISRDHIDGLINSCNLFISLHRAEGFGLTLAEAMVAGKPVIATDYSGNRDFMHSGNSFPVQYKTIKVTADMPIYTTGNKWAEGTVNLWADPDIDTAASLITYIKNNQEYAKTIAEEGRQYVLSNLSPEHIGNMMKRRLTFITNNDYHLNQVNNDSKNLQLLKLEHQTLQSRVDYLERTIYSKLRKSIKKWFHPNKVR